jgi:hypothetical protein
MFSGKRKAGDRMVIRDAAPSGRIMTGSTIGFRIVFFIDQSVMDVLMAIDTTNPNIPETPVAGFLMTGNAGSCQMTPFETESSLVVLVN